MQELGPSEGVQVEQWFLGSILLLAASILWLTGSSLNFMSLDFFNGGGAKAGPENALADDEHRNKMYTRMSSIKGKADRRGTCTLTSHGLLSTFHFFFTTLSSGQKLLWSLSSTQGMTPQQHLGGASSPVGFVVCFFAPYVQVKTVILLETSFLLQTLLKASLLWSETRFNYSNGGCLWVHAVCL